MKVIKTVEDKWSEDAVQHARNLVEYCENEPMKSVVTLRLTHKGDISVSYTTMDRLELLGALEYIKGRLINGD